MHILRMPGRQMRTFDTTLQPSVKIDRLLPANLRPEDAKLFEDVLTYLTYDCSLRWLGKARVSAKSVVYKNGRVVGETVVTREQMSYYRFRHLAKQLLTSKSIDLDRHQKHLLVTDDWSAGHFHWFMEVLPKLECIRKNAHEFVLLLPDTPYVKKIGIESLELLGLEFTDITWMKDDEFYSVQDLYYVPRIAGPGKVNDEIMMELNRRFRGDRASGKKRFYISRSKARIRKVLNESELESRLESYGFETIRPEYHSLREQIHTFAECESMIGIHGSGLTNCLFMPPGGKVVELRKREPNYGYWHLADSVGHKYYYYHGVPDSDLSLIGRGCNLTIPVDDFEEKILKAI